MRRSKGIRRPEPKVEGRRTDWTDKQVQELLIGPGARSAFASEAERLECWKQKRDELLGESALFERPWMFFAQHGALLWDSESTANYLERHGLLTSAEKLELARLRAQKQVPPAAIRRRPKDPGLRYFRFDGETEQEYADRLACKPTKWNEAFLQIPALYRKLTPEIRELLRSFGEDLTDEATPEDDPAPVPTRRRLLQIEREGGEEK